MTATTSSPQNLAQAAIERMQAHDFDEAINLSQQLVAGQPTGESQALLGTAYLLAQQYADAIPAFDRAIDLDPNHPKRAEWEAKREYARVNVESNVHDPRYPPVVPFDPKVLLAAASVPPGSIPDGPIETGVRPLRDRFLSWTGKVVGSALGAACTAVIDPVTVALSWAPPNDPVWTSWYRKRPLAAFATLVQMRRRLEKRNLVDPYPDGALTAFQSPPLDAPRGVAHSRTADGSWNAVNNPKEGAAGVRFPRNVARSASWPESGGLLLLPNPLEISQELLSRSGGMKHVPFLNMLAACWIQFMVHDWVMHHSVEHTTRHHSANPGGFYELPVPDGHPARELYYQTKMCIPKTEGDPARLPRDQSLPPTRINEVTSWWDASQIYGSDPPTAAALRAGKDGKLRLDGGRIPLHPTGGIEHTGFNRNWWFGLGLVHLLFAREHNAICDELKKHHPLWDDCRLYNVARLVNAAVIAKIHTIEWTPAILPNRSLNFAMYSNWYGGVEKALHDDHRKVLRWGKIRHPEIGGIVGNPTEKHGKPYGLTEEFTEVYRLHELLPETFVIKSRKTPHRVLEEVPLASTRQQSAHAVTGRHDLEDLFFSLGNQHPGALELNNYPHALRQLTIPGSHVIDLGAIDVLRARERGVPRYNAFRRQLGLKPIRAFEDLTDDSRVLQSLRSLYCDNVELIDMHVGTMAESVRPTNFGFGETLFQVFILNASRRLQADRFFTVAYDEETYSKEGLQWIDEADMKSVLLRHFPELGSTGLGSVANAFEPWDERGSERYLDDTRHPLRLLPRLF